jgi:hypothetical protein
MLVAMDEGVDLKNELAKARSKNLVVGSEEKAAKTSQMRWEKQWAHWILNVKLVEVKLSSHQVQPFLMYTNPCLCLYIVSQCN